MDLSYNNYFTQVGHGNSWKIKLGKCKHKIIQSWTQECIRAANIIDQTKSHPITLLFSGGIDSEFMIRVFNSAKVKYNVAIIDYGKWNKHDTVYAYRYCELHNITPKVVHVDIEKFISSGKFLEIAKLAKCCAHQMIPIMYGLTKLEGTLIMANGEPYLKNYEGEWRWQETERVNSYNDWYQLNNIDGTPDFLRYTPEMVVAFIKDPTVQELITNKRPGKLSTRTSKNEIFSRNYSFDPRPKYTGWEDIEQSNLHMPIYNAMYDLRRNYNGEFELEVSELLNSLL